MVTKKHLNIDNYLPFVNIENDSYILPYGDGPIFEKNPSYHLFLNMINLAKKSIYISTPYFIIDNEMINAICSKAYSGVDVRILIPGIPDKKAVYLMTRAHLGPMLKAGVKVYIYNIGFNHAKNIIVDNKYSFIGTVNMDYRSLLLHFEDGCLIYNDKSVHDMEEDFLMTISDLELMDYESFRKRNIFVKFLEFILQIVSPLF